MSKRAPTSFVSIEVRRDDGSKPASCVVPFGEEHNALLAAREAYERVYSRLFETLPTQPNQTSAVA